MARAESASASAHSDSIKGLAQAVARPAYRRLLTAEPFLRRAVPVLIVAFLVIAVGRSVVMWICMNMLGLEYETSDNVAAYYVVAVTIVLIIILSRWWILRRRAY